MEISQNLEFLVGGRRSLRDLRREVDGPAGVVLDLIEVVDSGGGGTTALGVGMDHGDRMGRIICCDANSRTTDADVERWDRRIAQVLAAGVTSLTDEIMGRWYTDGFRSSHPDVVARSAAMLAQVSAQGYVGCAEALKAVPYFDRLPTMGVPVLYIVGRQDGVAPETMAAMAARTPGSTIEVIDPGAHFPNVENPRAFNQVIADWLGIA